MRPINAQIDLAALHDNLQVAQPVRARALRASVLENRQSEIIDLGGEWIDRRASRGTGDGFTPVGRD